MAAVKHRHKARHQSEYDLVGDLERIKDAIYDTGADVKGRAGEMINESVEDLRSKTVYARDNVANYAAEKPFKTVGFAVLAGLVIGYFLHK